MSFATPSPTITRVSTRPQHDVSAICEALWICKSFRQAIDLVHLLSQVLNDNHLASSDQQNIDSSDIFLALQGVELRFRQLASVAAAAVGEAADNDTAKAEQQEYRSIQKAALSAVATLCRVMVGPAWQRQRDYAKQRMQLRHGNHDWQQRTRGASWSHQQQDEPTASSSSSTRSVPEVLPAAMIRFAASVLSRNNHTVGMLPAALLQAQFTIVSCLCHQAAADGSDKVTWSIPDVHEPLNSMVATWLDVAACEQSQETDDTEHLCMEVLANVNDLLANGWTPRNDDMVNRIVNASLQVATERLHFIHAFHCCDDNLPLAGTALDDVDIESNMACGAEALSILTTMGSRSMLRHDTAMQVVETTCELYGNLQLRVRRQTQADANNMNQRADLSNYTDSCMEDIEDLLLFLLADDGLADACVNLLMKRIALVDVSSELCRIMPTREWNDQHCAFCFQAALAIKILSTAFWVSSERPASLGLLRIYWMPFLEMILPMTISLFKVFSSAGEHIMTSDLSFVVAEMFLSLDRSMENEQSSSEVGGKFTELEWNILIRHLENSLIPWLCTKKIASVLVRENIKQFVNQLCRSLEYWTIYQNTPFVDYSAQESLYLVLLRSVATLLNPHQAETVGLAVVECWSKFGFFPFRLEDWSQTASKLLNEAFGKYSPGFFIHKPSVRLKALTVLTKAESSAVSVTMTTDPERAPSLLVLTQHTREQYLQFIGVINPVLELIIQSPEIADAELEVPPTSKEMPPAEPSYDEYAQEMESIFEQATPITRYTSLASYAIQLIGRLFYAPSGHRDHRQFFVDLLRQIALNECQHEIAYRIRLAAVLELESCLTASLTTLPHAHACVPSIVNSFTTIFKRYAFNCSPQPQTATMATVLAACSIDTLARLQIATDNHIEFRTKTELIDLPGKVLRRLFEAATPAYRSPVIETHGAPNLEAMIETKAQSGSDKTVISFDKIVAIALLYLQQPFENMFQPSSAIAFSWSCLRIQCYDILRHFCLAFFSYKIPGEIARTLFLADKTKLTLSEEYARCLTAIQYSENIFISARQGLQAANIITEDFKLALELVSSLFASDEIMEQTAASRAILSLVNGVCSQTTVGEYALSYICDLIRTRTTNEIPHGCNISRRRNIDGIFSVVFDLLIRPATPLSRDLRSLVFDFFIRFAEATSWNPDTFPNLLGLHCVANLLDVFDSYELESARKNLFDAQSNTLCAAALFNLINSIDRRTFVIGENHAAAKSLSKSKAIVDEERLVRQFLHDTSKDESRAAFLVDKLFLLTLRLGATDSRYVGCIECILRSPTSRNRCVVQIPSDFHLEHPDFISLSMKPNFSVEYGKSDPDLLCNGLPEYNVPDKTKGVLGRFETLMASPEFEDVPPKMYDSVLDRFDAALQHMDGNEESSHLVCDAETSKPATDIIIEWLEKLLTSKSDVSFVHHEILSFLKSCGFLLRQKSFPSDSLCRLKFDDGLARGISVLDFAPIMNTHKFALLYDQSPELKDLHSDLGAELLASKHCSPAFHNFANGLGSLVPTNTLKAFSGGLDTSVHETDGVFALAWTNIDETKSLVASTSVVYHVVSLMPSYGSRNVVNRKRHIGNDFVIICFTDRGSDAVAQYDLCGNFLGGAFGLVVIFVANHKPGMYRVNVRVRNVVTENGISNQCLLQFVGDYTVSDTDGPALVRNIAIRADLACRAVTGAPDALPNFVYRTEVLQNMQRFAV
ncbi:hypothetical protein MPSEU_000970200 [Mayamaea pseudoterrestris]|nr:hypothetical protein MPSEU_000970200 [Mayamaea pseudoterrestris]